MAIIKGSDPAASDKIEGFTVDPLSLRFKLWQIYIVGKKI